MRKLSGFILNLLLWATLTEYWWRTRQCLLLLLVFYNVHLLKIDFSLHWKKNLKIDFDYDNNNNSIILIASAWNLSHWISVSHMSMKNDYRNMAFYPHKAHTPFTHAYVGKLNLNTAFLFVAFDWDGVESNWIARGLISLTMHLTFFTTKIVITKWIQGYYNIDFEPSSMLHIKHVVWTK